ncbi:hypothetical protein [Acinetobacter bereziniae]|uniref:hypothetical protein n=1 Tax=Acinetobacter bereziniae TaxID=106648 RepID=UPI00124FB4B3|nr:hypothetical protein [Acinetobacter bereziniae]
MTNSKNVSIWNDAPSEAFHWERLPNGRCIWHCRKYGRGFSKKAPNFDVEQNSLWRDAEMQKEADETEANIAKQLAQFNIVLAR